MIRRTAECFFKALGRNFDDAQAAFSRRQFDHRLALDCFQTRSKPARRTFQQGNGRGCAAALAIEKDDETLQQFGEIVPGTDLKRNRPDGGDDEASARTLGLRDDHGGLGGAYPENHAGTAETLFALRIRRGRGGRTMVSGILRRSGLAMGFIRSATGDEREGDDGKTGDDDFFHNWNVGLMVNEQSIMTPSVAPTLWGVTLS